MDNICSVCGSVLTKVDLEYNNECQAPFVMCSECIEEWLDSESDWDDWNDGYDEDRDLLGY